MGWLKGKKTLIVAALMVVTGFIQFLTGDMTLAELVQSESFVLILEGLGLGFLRAGVKKAE